MRRVVLDTDVLVSALLLASGRLAPIRHAWQSGRIVPALCKATADELLRVLRYPKLGLSDDERDELLADLLPQIESHEHWRALRRHSLGDARRGFKGRAFDSGLSHVL